METAVEARADVTVVRIAGSVDGTTAAQLQDVFAAQLAAGRRCLVAALDGVDYTSSAGLRVLLVTVKEARTGGGDLRLAAPRRDVLKVLERSGYTGILKVYADLEAAVASFGT
jgi:anti-sigma B factor antagonist